MCASADLDLEVVRRELWFGSMINGCAAVTSMVHIGECYHQQECVHPYWCGHVRCLCLSPWILISLRIDVEEVRRISASDDSCDVRLL